MMGKNPQFYHNVMIVPWHLPYTKNATNTKLSSERYCRCIIVIPMYIYILFFICLYFLTANSAGVLCLKFSVHFATFILIKNLAVSATLFLLDSGLSYLPVDCFQWHALLLLLLLLWLFICKASYFITFWKTKFSFSHQVTFRLWRDHLN